jgi:expansin (peptidoglycan-binding protein)
LKPKEERGMAPPMQENPFRLFLAVALIGGCSASNAGGGSTVDPVTPPPPPATAFTAAAPVESAPPVVTAAASAPAAPVASASAPAPAASAPTAVAALSGEGKGEASYYTADRSSCSLPPPPDKDFILSASKDIYQNAQACGTCLEITGAAGTKIVQVMDYCYSCAPGHVVLNQPAYDAIVGKTSGTGPISWKNVLCPVTGNVAIRIKESSTKDWTAVQIRHSKMAIKSVELKRDGQDNWVETKQSPDNYWAAAKGAGLIGFKLRITGVTGQQIEETIEKGWKDGKTYPGAHQF